MARLVSLVVTPGPPWRVGQNLTLKATVTDDGVSAVGELVLFNILIYLSGQPTISYSMPNGTTDSLGVATIEWVIPATRNSTPIAEQNVAFRAYDNATLTSSNLVSGYVAGEAPPIPLLEVGLVLLAIIGGGAAYYVSREVRKR